MNDIRKFGHVESSESLDLYGVLRWKIIEYLLHDKDSHHRPSTRTRPIHFSSRIVSQIGISVEPKK